MREVIKEIQNKLGITTVYVTHDQEEAMAVSDRIAVMNHGEIQQIGTPKELYLRPQNTFVANFVGSSNFVPAKIFTDGNRRGVTFENGTRVDMDNLDASVVNGQSVIVSIRPEEFVLAQTGIEATVKDSAFLGMNTHYFAELATGEDVIIVQESTFANEVRKGSVIHLNVKKEKINIFTEDGARTLIC